MRDMSYAMYEMWNSFKVRHQLQGFELLVDEHMPVIYQSGKSLQFQLSY